VRLHVRTERMQRACASISGEEARRRFRETVPAENTSFPAPTGAVRLQIGNERMQRACASIPGEEARRRFRGGTSTAENASVPSTDGACELQAAVTSPWREIQFPLPRHSSASSHQTRTNGIQPHIPPLLVVILQAPELSIPKLSCQIGCSAGLGTSGRPASSSNAPTDPGDER
jgi:hypothetical protein